MDSIQVLHSVGTPNDTTNPYIVRLVAETSGGVSPLYFSWSKALVGKYSIFHVHWPEHLFRTTGWLRVPKAILCWLLVLRLWITRRPVVWTVHNESPHEPGGTFERLFLKCLERLVCHRIYLTEPNTGASVGNSYSIIPHGHYKEWFESFETTAPVGSRFLFCGLIRPYKGVEKLVEAFRELRDPESSLVLAGKPLDTPYAQLIGDIASSDSRITAILEYISDKELVRHVSESKLVVLPYRHVGNSGVLLMALSLSRPVLLPDSNLARYMKTVVGAEWINVYEGQLSYHHLSEAMRNAQKVMGSAPNLATFEWPAIGESHISVYREVIVGGG